MDKNKETYSDALAQYGANDPRSVKMGTKQTQYFRFKILSEIADVSEKKILDLGCGVGDLYDYLRTQGFTGKYIGIDHNEDLIAAAKLKYPDCEFSVSSDPAQFSFDYCFISGTFNDNIEKETIYQLITNRSLI
jgi:2-polyprenyl-3-methyl-5-hydroxy-6-metoxy-1,4-benzoquinol methylase